MGAVAARVFLTDFGLARSMATGSRFTRTGEALGTPRYMSPEQARGETADARSDIFSFGIILYELVAGRRPFAGASTAELTSSILRDEPEPLCVRRPEVPAELERIVGRCLVKSPERRYQSAKDLSIALAELHDALRAGARARRAPVADRAERPEEVGIAVLPFENLSGSEDDRYFTDGMTDELLTALSRVPGLRVPGRSSAFALRGRNWTPQEIGKALGVSRLVEGSVRRAGDRVRIATDLVNVSDGYRIWSHSFERRYEDLFALQEEVARAVAGELRKRLAGVQAVEQPAGGRADLQAYDLYLRGRGLGVPGGRELAAALGVALGELPD